MSAPSTPTVTVTVPRHWSPEQALAVLEYLHALRCALWEAHGQQVQQA